MDATLQGKKSLFRVQYPDAEPVYHARRPHRKSRSGCSTCKRRRVKCDETKPVCTRCQKHGVVCEYESAAEFPVKQVKSVVTQIIERYPYLNSFDPTGYSMSLSSVAEKIDELLQVKPGARPGTGMDCLATLHHFQDHTLSNGGLMISRNWRSIIELSFSSPLLMHAIIAAASTHLVTVVPDNKSYQLTEAYHWHETTTQYTQELSHITPTNMDIMLSTCLLLTLNTFPLPDYNPRASFVFSPFPSQALSWLSLQSGLRHLLSIINPWLRESLWFDTFMASRGDPDVFEDSRRGRIGLHPGLADLCEISDDAGDENPYWLPIRVLTPMLKLHPCAENLGRFTNFMGRLVPSFFEVLVRKETPALVVLAWWLGIMGRVDMWWARKRVWSEVYGICMFLEDEGRLDEDGRVRELMRFPAGVCGFSLDSPR